MEKTEKLRQLDEVIKIFGLTNEDLKLWWNIRRNQKNDNSELKLETDFEFIYCDDLFNLTYSKILDFSKIYGLWGLKIGEIYLSFNEIYFSERQKFFINGKPAIHPTREHCQETFNALEDVRRHFSDAEKLLIEYGLAPLWCYKRGDSNASLGLKPKRSYKSYAIETESVFIDGTISRECKCLKHIALTES